MKKLVAFVILALFVFLKVMDYSPVEILRLKTFDYLLTSKTPVQSDNVVIVSIDEKSIKQKGQWPWARKDIAETMGTLFKRGAGIVVFPVLMSEKDRMGTDEILSEFLKKQKGVVISQTPTTQKGNEYAYSRGFSAIGNDPLPYIPRWNNIIGPLPAFGNNVSGVGMAATTPEIDGVVRRLPMLVAINSDIYPSIPLETIRVAVGSPSFQIKSTEAGVEAVRVRGFKPMTTDSNGRIWLNWNYKFRKISYTDIDKVNLKGKIVILGLEVEGVGGIIATPLGSKWSHEIQAMGIESAIQGKTPVRFAFANLLEALTIGVVGLLVILLTPILSPFVTYLLYPVFVGLSSYFSYYVFKSYGQLWDASFLVVSFTIIFGYMVILKFLKELFLKLQIKKQFGTYLSPALVEKLQKNPDLLKLGGETRDLSIMFTDVRGFTSISEHYGDNVQGLTQIMNRYMTAMTEKIIKNEGTLDKYIGDAQMAFWNAPLDNPKHARDAVKTALEMLDDLDKFNAEIEAEGVPAFGMGIGINTGSVVVGNMGSDQRFDYTCLGDSVNLASRLEGQSKNYGVRLVIGEETAKQVINDYNVIKLDTIAVKGKTIGVGIYTIMSKDDYNPVYWACHKDFRKYYKEGNWDQTLLFLDSLKKDKVFNGFLKEYYFMMEERVVEYKNNPPKDWDGTYKATSK